MEKKRQTTSSAKKGAATAKQPTRLSRLTKLVRARRTGKIFIGSAVHPIELSKRQTTKLMVHYLSQMEVAKEDVDEALDIMSTAIGPVIDDALLLGSKMYKIPAGRAGPCVALATSELSDLCAIFAHQKHYKNEYTEIIAAIKAMQEIAQNFLPPVETWETPPAPPPIPEDPA